MNENEFRRFWLEVEPGRLVGRGHVAGDFLEAHEWRVLEERKGFLRVDAHLPRHVINPRGQLFGGFTPTYVDFIALFTVRAGEPRGKKGDWLATTNMRVDYFDPVVGPRFLLESRIVRDRGRTVMVETKFIDPDDDNLLVFALTTLRKVPGTGKLGDA